MNQIGYAAVCRIYILCAITAGDSQMKKLLTSYHGIALRPLVSTVKVNKLSKYLECLHRILSLRFLVKKMECVE